MFFVFLVIALLGGSIIPSTHAQDVNPTDEVASDLKVFNEHYSERYITLADGTKIVESIINGPPTPPLGQSEWINATDLQPEAIILPNFPSYSWVFGCTAVSAAMIAAYQTKRLPKHLYRVQPTAELCPYPMYGEHGQTVMGIHTPATP